MCASIKIEKGGLMFAFTRQERQVVLFLVTLALAGCALNFAAKLNSKSSVMPVLNLDIGKVDLNRADKQMLMEMPGIGEKLAERILEYRTREGAFGEVEELKNISGINNYRYEKLKGYFTVK